MAITEAIQYTHVDIPESNVTFYPETQRVKTVLFNRPYSAEEITGTFLDAWAIAGSLYSRPLAQVRAIMPLSQEAELLTQFDNLHAAFPEDAIGVVGRIPFTVDGERYGIYYCQAASHDRALLQTEPVKTHEEAVAYGERRRRQNTFRELPEGFHLSAVEFIDGQARDILDNNRELPIDADTFARELVDLHKSVFPIPHDPSQQTIPGMKNIVTQNPTLVMCDADGTIVSAGLLERDDRFTFGAIALVEPTYFTRDGNVYRGHGFSSHIRQAAQEIVRHNVAYGGIPIICFNESIRNTSFQIALENWCQLAGDGKRITGDLGEGYTLIGKGFKPLGITFNQSPQLGVQDQWMS